MFEFLKKKEAVKTPSIDLNSPVKAVMQKKVESTTPFKPAIEVAERMAEKNIGSLIVTDPQVPAGIITERDFYRKISAKGINLKGLKAFHLMNHPLYCIREDTSIQKAAEYMSRKRIRRLPVVHSGQLKGIVSETDIIRVYEGMDCRVEVEAVMTPHVVTAGSWYSISKISRLMREKKVGSVVLLKDEAIQGFITERDILHKVLVKGGNSDDLKARDVMTKKVIFIGPQATLTQAAALMHEKRIRRVPVLRDDKLEGLLSQTDLVDYLASQTV